MSSPAQRAAAGRWRGWRIELFGRESLMAPWRAALTEAGLMAAAEETVPEDAPSQAADEAMARRVAVLLAQDPPPERIAIASNDKGFDRVDGAERLGDLPPSGLLRLVVAELGGVDGTWVSAGGAGDHLRRRFGLDIRGRLIGWAQQAGLEIRHGHDGLWFR